MNVIAFNGSPRKKWNTATLLGYAPEGAASQGAETDPVHLRDRDSRDKRSCCACKLNGGKSYGRCGIKDRLTPVLEKIPEADTIIPGYSLFRDRYPGDAILH